MTIILPGRPPADTLWSRRLFRIKQATGWTNEQLAQRGGMAIKTIRRIFAGCRPTMPVIFRIKALETHCGADLEALDQGFVTWIGGKRVDYRDDRYSRPRDLADLGQPVGLEDGRCR